MGKRPLLPFIYMVLPAVILAVFALCPSGAAETATDVSVVRVGSEPEFPPYAIVDKEGMPAGFSVDLIKAVAEAMGLRITISTGPWDTLWNDLVDGRLDMLPLVARMPERAQLVDFGLPHTETFDAFFMRKGDSPIPDIKGARGKEIVVMRSDAAHHALEERNFQGNLFLVDTIPEGLSLISSGKHDAMLCSKLIGTLEIKEHDITGLAAGPPVPDYKRVFSFAVKKGDGELLEKLNQGLMIIKTNGVYDQLYEKWLAIDDPWLKFEKYLMPAAVFVMVAILIAGVWLIMLQRMVGKRTRELAETNEMLSRTHEELEERVSRRTSELTQLNRVLQNEITERKRAEDLTKRLASFPQLNPNPVMETDSAGNITYYNPAITKVLEGFGMGMNDIQVFLPDNFEGVLQELNRNPESTYYSEVCIKDRVFSTTVHYVPEFSVARIYSHDITERKKVEADIVCAKEEWERTFNSVPDLIAILDRDHRIIRANRAMAERMGMSSGQCVGMKCFTCVHGAHLPPDMCPHTLTMKDGKEHTAELHEDNLGGDFLVTTTPMYDGEGKMTGSVHVARDITERKRSEDRLRMTLDELQHRQSEISALLEASRAVMEQRDFSETARFIFESCKKLIGATAGYVALLSDDGKENEVLFLDPGGLPCTVDPSLPMPIRGLRSVVYSTGKAAFDNDFARSKWMEFMPDGHANLDNVLFVPLLIGGKVTGLLGLANKPGGFSSNDARMSSAFGELASIALHNSNLFDLLKSSEEKLSSVVQTANDAIITIDGSGDILFWNRGAEDIFGYKAHEVEGRQLDFIIPEKTGNSQRTEKGSAGFTEFEKITGKSIETTGIRKDGKEFPIDLSLAKWESGDGTFFTGIIRDITGRKEAERSIRASLEEKELLLREIHHRVKNNLMVVFGLLKLQSRHVRDEHDRGLFKESMARIKSMALIHEKLYRSENLAVINMGKYISELTGSMFMTYQIPYDRIRLHTDVGDVALGIDLAIPCGLIVNELISNSMKHAFNDEKAGEIRVLLHEIPGNGLQDEEMDREYGKQSKKRDFPESEVELIVSDDGSGIPDEVDIANARSLGLNVVHALVKQIHGKIEVLRGNGTEFRIRFKNKQQA